MIPSAIGPYQIVRKLGQGGMGEVYEGLHQEIESHVAIKVLRPELSARPEALTRFKNEARAVSKIKHPGLVQIFDFGRLPDGSVYLVMEKLQGVTLTERVQQRGGRFDEAEALRLAWHLSDALSEAHALGITHRDVKPANIMLVADRAAVGGERLKLLDFGIARLGERERERERARETHDDAPPTRTGQLLGTPRYMSPEQCKASSQIDGKADVYALGVLLYQMLAGQPPFQADSEMEIIAMHLTEPPPPLSDVATGTSRRLVDLIHRMLAKAPAERPSMQEVKSELYGMGADEPLPSPRSLLTQRMPAQAPPLDATTIEKEISRSATEARTQRLPPRGLRLAAFSLSMLLIGSLIMVWVLRSKSEGTAVVPQPPTVIAPKPAAESPPVLTPPRDQAPPPKHLAPPAPPAPATAAKVSAAKAQPAKATRSMKPSPQPTKRTADARIPIEP